MIFLEFGCECLGVQSTILLAMPILLDRRRAPPAANILESQNPSSRPDTFDREAYRFTKDMIDYPSSKNMNPPSRLDSLRKNRLELEPWVHIRTKKINDNIDKNKHRREQNYDSLNQRKVSLEDRKDGQQPQPRVIEHIFDHDDTPQ